jgi:hypothetical protein
MSLSRTTLTMRAVLALAVTLIVGPVLSMAGMFDSCCVKCRKVRMKCCCPRFCPPPMPVQPSYRLEPVTEQVPVTTYDTVCVDEGSYTQVWVPKVVAKQVPRTVMQTRVSYRRVAVDPCPPATCPPSFGGVPGAVPGAAPYSPSQYNAAPATGGATLQGPQTFSNETFSTPGLSVPTLGGPSATPTTVTPMPSNGTGTTDRLVPMPTDSGNATPILPRNASGSASATGSPMPILPKTATKAGKGAAGQFSAPPSAAMVWRSQLNATR